MAELDKQNANVKIKHFDENSPTKHVLKADSKKGAMPLSWR